MPRLFKELPRFLFAEAKIKCITFNSQAFYKKRNVLNKIKTSLLYLRCQEISQDHLLNVICCHTMLVKQLLRSAM